MARKFHEEINEWSKGVVVADYASDKVPLNAASRARNTAWIKNGYPSKRKGCPIVTLTAQAGQSPIRALGHFNNLNWTISQDGKWSKVTGSNPNGVFSAIDAGNPSPFTAGLTTFPITAVAKNLLFAVNGTDAKKTDGTTVSNFGITAMAAPTVTDSGVAGNPSGTYSVNTVAYNKNTGHPSSASPSASVTVTGKKIHVAWVFPADAQVTHVRVNIFKNSLTQQFFQLTATDVSVAPDITTGGYDSGTTAIDVNVTDADINNLLLVAPNIVENNPPPANTKFIFFHGTRMFATDGNYLYYSKIDDPESFDPNSFEPVNTNDDQKIIGFVTLVDQHLIIFKDRSTYLLIGPDDPKTWEIQELDISIGLASPRGIAVAEGSVWWEALQGLFRLQYTGPFTVSRPQRMDSPTISDRLENLNDSQIGISCAAYDMIRQRVFFAVPDAFETVNTSILPYNNRLGFFEDTWDPIEVSAMGLFIDSGEPYVAIGGYYGRVFRMWQTPYLDGVRQTLDDGTTLTTLASTATGGGTTSLTDTLATFDTQHDGLKGISVTTISPDLLFAERNVILSNTSTVLTLKYNWSVVPTAGWTYCIGSPFFEFDTKHMHPTSVPDKEGSEFYTRNFKTLYMKGTTDTTLTMCNVLMMIDGDVTNFALEFNLNVNSGGAVFDTDKFDVGKFGTGSASVAKQSLGLHGHTCGVRVRNCDPGAGVILLGIGLYGTELTDKV